jgi:hypothetical protein
MRLRLNADAQDVAAFLERHAYPFEWTADVLARHCYLTSIETSSGVVAGYVWFNFLKGTDRALDVHICIAPEFQSKALTPPVIVALLLYAMSLDARSVVARCATQADLSMIQRMGFRTLGPFSVLSLNPLDTTLPAFIRRGVLRRIERQSWVKPLEVSSGSSNPKPPNP